MKITTFKTSDLAKIGLLSAPHAYQVIQVIIKAVNPEALIYQTEGAISVIEPEPGDEEMITLDIGGEQHSSDRPEDHESIWTIVHGKPFPITRQ